MSIPGPTEAPILLTGRDLTLEQVWSAARGAPVVVADAARERVRAARAMVDRLAASPTPTYGINTGFGSLAETPVAPGDLSQLQYNLIVSHAAGVGTPLPQPVVRALMTCRANVLAGGHSGIRESTLDLLVALINRGVVPVVPSRGSVGASGDLAPLAHLALVLIGRGEAWIDGERVPGAEALRRAGLEPVVLAPKEGLALVNGTQAMLALGAVTLEAAEKAAASADIVGALTIEALEGSHRPFLAEVHTARGQAGQIEVAAHMRTLLADSEINVSHVSCHRVQDPYSLRCLPQVHGAVRDGLRLVRDILSRELNAATDNPLLFPDTDQVVSAGNFHGQPLSMALDILAIAVAQLATISERRIEQLVNPMLSRLPPFLMRQSGLNSGFMIGQVTAAALVVENRVLCHPASVDTIPSSAGREDHVSMGMTAALKAAQVVEHVQSVLGIELLCAAQGLDFRRPMRAGRGVEAAHALVRQHIPFMDTDRELHLDIQRATALIADGSLVNAAATV